MWFNRKGVIFIKKQDMPLVDLKNELKNEFTTYWSYLAIRAACKINLFDLFEEKKYGIDGICEKINTDKKVIEPLLTFLVDEGYLSIDDVNNYYPTKKGSLLSENHPDSLKYACIIWGEEHLLAWQNLPYTLKTGNSSFENIYGSNFFEYLSNKPNKLIEYHKAMYEYARDDYSDINKIHDFSQHKSIMDVGGSLGALIKIIAKKNKNTQCILFDKPELAKYIDDTNIDVVFGDFFKLIPSISDAIIMSRIIHDWNDTEALIILNNCYKALPLDGTLYIIENLTNKIENSANLLSLNMHLITNSFERSYYEYEILLDKACFKIEIKKQVNSNQYLIKAIKRHEL